MKGARIRNAILGAAFLSVVRGGGAGLSQPGGGNGEAGPTPVDVVFTVSVPDATPDSAEVYIAGDFQGWNPGHPAYRLSAIDDGRYQITLRFAPGTMLQFKFTLGSWPGVEKGPAGEEIPNRVLTVTGPAEHTFTVATWAGGKRFGSTILGDVRRISVPGFLHGRRVWIYLPPGYDDDLDRRYPVLYMLDGQNVFDHATSFAGEWEVDEACEQLIADREMAPIIVVGVANGESDRVDEYTPWSDEETGKGGAADAHLRAFREILIPYIDTYYRTLPRPENRAIAGSSLGGLLAIYAGFTEPETYGLVAGLSPSLSWAGERLRAYVESRPRPPIRLYLDMGTRESGALQDGDGNDIDDHVDRLRRLRGVLVAKGFESPDLFVVEDEGANHHETFWASRFREVLRYLFPPG